MRKVRKRLERLESVARQWLSDINSKTACFILRAEQAFLSHMDGGAELAAIQRKLSSGEALTDSDLMKLVILPLTVPGQKGKHEMLETVVDLAEQLPEQEQKVFALSGAIVASDKFIQQEYKEQRGRKPEALASGFLIPSFLPSQFFA